MYPTIAVDSQLTASQRQGFGDGWVHFQIGVAGDALAAEVGVGTSDLCDRCLRMGLQNVDPTDQVDVVAEKFLGVGVEHLLEGVKDGELIANGDVVRAQPDVDVVTVGWIDVLETPPETSIATDRRSGSKVHVTHQRRSVMAKISTNHQNADRSRFLSKDAP